LGLIFYQILAGHNPFEEVAAVDMAIERHAAYREAQVRARAEGARPLGEIGHPELSDHPLLVAMVERCLRFRPVERYDDAAALLRDLERYAAGCAIHIVPEEKPSDPAAPSAGLDRLLAEAQAYLENGRLAEAGARCEEARRRFPKSGKPYRWLAEILLHEDNWENALQVCAEGLEIDPDEPELYDAAGNARAMGNQAEAAAMMRQAGSNLRRAGNK
jgi:tetratricopeptide (TPR) repeat protein